MNNKNGNAYITVRWRKDGYDSDTGFYVAEWVRDPTEEEVKAFIAQDKNYKYWFRGIEQDRSMNSKNYKFSEIKDPVTEIASMLCSLEDIINDEKVNDKNIGLFNAILLGYGASYSFARNELSSIYNNGMPHGAYLFGKSAPSIVETDTTYRFMTYNLSPDEAYDRICANVRYVDTVRHKFDSIASVIDEDHLYNCVNRFDKDVFECADDSKADGPYGCDTSDEFVIRLGLFGHGVLSYLLSPDDFEHWFKRMLYAADADLSGKLFDDAESDKASLKVLNDRLEDAKAKKIEHLKEYDDDIEAAQSAIDTFKKEHHIS